MQRISMHEAIQNSQNNGYQSENFPLYSSAFMDARQTLLHFCRNYENGYKSFVIQDKDQNEAICVRVSQS